MAVQQLETISGVARGLTRTSDSLLVLDESPEVQKLAQQMQQARADPRTVNLRQGLLDAIRKVVDIWCADASISDVRIIVLLRILD